MKKIYSLMALVAVASLNAQILKAGFDDVKGKGGNDNVWAELNDQTPLPDSFAQAGWEKSGEVYSGAECLRIGTGKKQGGVTSPKLTGLNGDAILSFRAGGWDKKNESNTISVKIIGGGNLDKSQVEIPKGQFGDFKIKITGANPNSRIVFEGKGAKNRFFLDDILIDSPNLGTAEWVTKRAELLAQTLVYNELEILANTNLNIYSVDGRHMMSSQVRKGEKLNITHLDTGIYIATGLIEGRNVSVKFIKK